MKKRNFLKMLVDLEKKHPFHLVNPSPLPFLLSFSLLGLIFGVIVYLHQSVYVNFNGLSVMLFFLLTTILLLIRWWQYVIKESFLLFHNKYVAKGLKIGFGLFIISEVMFFFGFFRAYFYNALSPSIWIGGVWPPFAIRVFNPLTLPLANTGILLTSGITITYAHMYMNLNDHSINVDHDDTKFYYYRAKEGIALTLFLAVIFLYIQFQEFYYAPFNISDGIYGSTFFMITGLHGFHVIIGTIFIGVCYYRFSFPKLLPSRLKKMPPFHANYKFFQVNKAHTNYLITTRLSTGFITASWYWHFVDVVWIYVYIFLYVFSYV